MFVKHAFVAVCILTLAACGGGGSAALPHAGSSPRNSDARFTISIPPAAQQSAQRTGKYVSPNTQSLTIAVNGAAPSVTANVTASSGGCSTSSGTITCTVNVTAPVGNDTFAVTLYSGTNAGGSKLASGSVSATVGSAPTSVPITLDGVVDSVSISLGNSMPYAGSAVTIPVTVTAKDASGATIISPGGYSPAITLTNSDASGHTTLSPTTISDPGTAVTLAYDGSTSLSSATISATVSGTITTVSSATLTPQVIENGGGGVGVVTLGGRTFAEVPTAIGLLQVPIATGGTLPTPSPSATPQTTLLSLNPQPDACAIAPNGENIYAYCVSFALAPANVNVVDLTSGTPILVKSIPTDAAALFDSSGGECYICGVAWDPQDKAVLISTTNGYEFYDPVTGNQVRATIPLTVAENFGYNPTTNQIWSPQEETNGEEEDLVDVASGTWYAITPSLNTMLQEPDAGAVDSNTNVAISLDEFTGNTAIIPLSSAILSTPAPGASPPAGTFTDANVTTNSIMEDSGCETNAVSVDPTKHVAFISGEYSSPDCVGAVQLPAAAPSAPWTPTSYMWIPALPDTPDGNTFDSALDPHVAATFYLPGNGDLYGLVFNYDRSYVAVIDIDKLLAAPASSTEPHQVDPAYDLFANGVLTYVPTGISPGPASAAAFRKPAARRRH
ncbi:MAG TPA: hypothetical protein VFH72_10185 [Candidatus Baltobacteraceae bacterium]|nr:hypothetical protein [Candidatus Baltobacteraceae bacterium]